MLGNEPRIAKLRHLHLHIFSRGIFTDYWEHMISFETQRAKEFGIEHFVCISVNPKEANQRPLAIDAIEAMKRYLDRERVVAIIELGYNLINDLEEEVFVKQMDIAAESMTEKGLLA